MILHRHVHNVVMDTGKLCYINHFLEVGDFFKTTDILAYSAA
ncbi:hypothetical protein MGSAQ_002419 [marine sediment metagenome]|uniref:Uncharacterized protein n=1 Tax=marine sediment metagenome TaxID=412755 RepID=A0A1B6NRH6_9ZZZZ